METNSSGEELLIKTRKPYTITKQRERWTEEEHNRFLEALKLYGRAWQKIEEHIGTKTAVQIRSHAQKFFSKLEKESHAKGIPVGQALDMDIPPPRPKRKPSNPYPRKTCNGTPTSQLGGRDGKLAKQASSLHSKRALNSEKESLTEKANGERPSSNVKETQEDDCLDCFTCFQEACSSSMSSVNKNYAPTLALRNSCGFGEFLPSPKQVIPYIIVQPTGNQSFMNLYMNQAIPDNGTSKASDLENTCSFHDKSVQGMEQNAVNGISPIVEEGTQSYPRHVPVHVLDGSSVTCTLSPPNIPLQDPTFCPMEEIHGHPNSFTNPAASATTTEHQNDAPRSTYQALPTFHPAFAPIPHTQDDYRSFSNLIVSTLLQNPAIHAAAAFAASFWPHNSGDLSRCAQGGFPPRQMNSPPSLAAIVAATVAAAASWWAAHGLLPLCAPVHAAFTGPPPSTTDTGKAPDAKIDTKETALRNPSMQDQQLDPEYSKALQPQHSPSKSTTSTSSDSEESGRTKLNTGTKPGCHRDPAAETDHDSNGTKSRKQVDRSSCGSNTPSSSDVETDALEKREKGKDEAKDEYADNPLASESSTRRSKSSNSLNDSWKAVSEEGRLAFQTLFSRDILPQSFSPPHDANNKRNQKENTEAETQNTDDRDGEALALDLNSKTQSSSPNHQEEKKKVLPNGEDNDQKGLLAIGLGNGKLKARKTGFKPYKRCSVEAKESRVLNTTSSQVEEKGPKRIRLEGEAST